MDRKTNLKKYKRIPDENWVKLPFVHNKLSQKYKHTQASINTNQIQPFP